MGKIEKLAYRQKLSLIDGLFLLYQDTRITCAIHGTNYCECKKGTLDPKVEKCFQCGENHKPIDHCKAVKDDAERFCECGEKMVNGVCPMASEAVIYPNIPKPEPSKGGDNLSPSSKAKTLEEVIIKYVRKSCTADEDVGVVTYGFVLKDLASSIREWIVGEVESCLSWYDNNGKLVMYVDDLKEKVG